MYRAIALVFFTLVYVTASIPVESDRVCYLDHCQNLTTSTSASGNGCSLMKIQSGTDCGEFGSGESLPTDSTAKFYLLAFVSNFGRPRQRATAFNLTVTDATFDSLVIQYQNIPDGKLAECVHVNLYRNKNYSAPMELHISCPFSYDTHLTADSKLQLLVTGDRFWYVRQYIFKVPDYRLLGEDARVSEYVPFTYIDTSVSSVLTLYVQRHPESFNIKEYKIWLINNDTKSANPIHADVPSDLGEKFLTYNFNVGSGAYYFKVSAVHPDCGSNGCPNSTTPVVVISGRSYRLLIMIVSTVWIPPAVVYALYRIYKGYKEERITETTKQPKCLLVYAPTRPAHVKVITELAKYLRLSDIDAIIDTLEATDSTERDLSAWCSDAFDTFPTVLIAASPPHNESTFPSHSSTELFRLFKENSLDNSKRYLRLLFPYCRVENIADAEARQSRLFHLPDDLSSLVKAIHGDACKKYSLPCDKELLESIQLAEADIAKESNILENIEETDGLLPSGKEGNKPITEEGQD